MVEEAAFGGISKVANRRKGTTPGSITRSLTHSGGAERFRQSQRRGVAS